MSSILKALKKLENEVPEKKDRRDPHQFYAKKAIQKRVKSHFFFNKSILIIFTFIMILIGGGLALTFKPWLKEPTRAVRAEIKPTAVNRLEKDSPIPALQQQDILSGKNKEEFDLSSKAFEKPSRSPHNLRKEAPEPIEFVGVPEGKLPDEQPVKRNTHAGKNEKASERKTGDYRFESIPIRPASESLLELQAIAWSENPEKRIAVINSHIVHEGESVENATVKHIGQNAVVFEKGSDKWRQLFRITSNVK